MKTFILNILKFSLFFLLFFLIAYYLDFYIKNFKKNNAAIYIWGDSQTYEGININLLKDLTKKKVYTSAIHGAGVYDFLVFSEMIPENSTVLIALSKPVQIRKKYRDRNVSGILFPKLWNLFMSNYSFLEIFDVIKSSRKPIKLFKTNSNRNTNLFIDSLELTNQIKAFKNYYKEVPNYIYDKQKLYAKGFKTLISKQCKIVILEFPYHPKLEIVEENSILKKETDKFKEDIIDLVKNINMDSIVLRNPENMMHDLTHLNRIGADYVTKNISVLVLKNEGNSFVEIKNN